MQIEVDPKTLRLRQKDDQLEQQGTELREKVAQINRQQRELQTVMVRKLDFYIVWKDDVLHLLGGQKKITGRGGG